VNPLIFPKEEIDRATPKNLLFSPEF